MMTGTLAEPTSNVRVMAACPACSCWGRWGPVRPPLDGIFGPDAQEWYHAEGCSA